MSAASIARWVPYYLYRSHGNGWPEGPFFVMRLLFYCLLWSMLAVSHNFAALFTPTALLLMLWNLFRARKELRRTLAGIHRIDREEPPLT